MDHYVQMLRMLYLQSVCALQLADKRLQLCRRELQSQCNALERSIPLFMPSPPRDRKVLSAHAGENLQEMEKPPKKQEENIAKWSNIYCKVSLFVLKSNIIGL